MVVDVDRTATEEVAAADEDATAVEVLVATTVAVDVEDGMTEVEVARTEVARTEVEVARTEVEEARAVWGTVAQMAEPTEEAAVSEVRLVRVSTSWALRMLSNVVRHSLCCTAGRVLKK